MRRGVRWWLKAALCTHSCWGCLLIFSIDDCAVLGHGSERAGGRAGLTGKRCSDSLSETSSIINTQHRLQRTHSQAGDSSKRASTSAKQSVQSDCRSPLQCCDDRAKMLNTVAVHVVNRDVAFCSRCVCKHVPVVPGGCDGRGAAGVWLNASSEFHLADRQRQEAGSWPDCAESRPSVHHRHVPACWQDIPERQTA